MGYRVRKKKNSSGSTSIQIIDRKNRGYKVVETIGCSKDDSEIEIFYRKALKRIDELENNLLHFSKEKKHNERLAKLFSSITTDNIVPIGDELIYGRLLDEIDCNAVFETASLKKIKEKQFLFRSPVISRILYPGSKLYLADYLEYFKKQTISTDTIYRFLYTLYSETIKCKIANDGETGTKILGRISMDNTVFASKRESIEVFNDAKEIAKSVGTIPYEVLTSLNSFLERIVL